MSRLEYPLKDMLRDPTEEPALRRIWERIDGRLPDARGALAAVKDPPA